MSERALIYIPSEEIVDFVRRNPIDWLEDKQKHSFYYQKIRDVDAGKKRFEDRRNYRVTDFSCRGGFGDQAGVPPTPSVQEFLDLLIVKRGLFTQEEYMKFCVENWKDWITDKNLYQKWGIKAKLYRNFYPSMIDSLHVWAMMAETSSFEMCLLSATEDAIGKSDLVLRSGARELRIALQIESVSGKDDRAYKKENRNKDESECIEVWLSMNEPKSPGNKRWYRKADVMKTVLTTAYTPQSSPEAIFAPA